LAAPVAAMARGRVRVLAPHRPRPGLPRRGIPDAGRRTAIHLRAGGGCRTARLSPDQATLAAVVNEQGYGRLHLLDAATGAVLARPEHPKGVITKVTWHPDGQSLAFDLAQPTRPGTLWQAKRSEPKATLLFAPAEPPAG